MGHCRNNCKTRIRFASQLKRLLRLRERYRIYEATQVAVLGKGSLLVMVHVLPDGRYQITAINFGAEPVEQTVLLPEAVSGRVVDVLSAETVTTLTNTTRLLFNSTATPP